MNILEIIISAAGGAGIALSAAAWLFRTWITQRFSIELEERKGQLTQKTEVLKTELSIYAHEQSVGLSRIDAQRSEALLAIWAVVTQWHDVFLDLTAPNERLGLDVPTALEKYQEWARSLMTLSDKLSIEVRNRTILLSKPTFEVIAKCGAAISDVTNDFYAASFEAVNLEEPDDKNSLFDRVQHARHALRAAAVSNVNELRDALVVEFRRVMKA
jgi:hypothetical protein